MPSDRPNPWQKELDDFLRAFSGAFLFGVPLLFTLEMWQIGASIDDWKLLLILVLAILMNIPLTYFAGFKGKSTFRTSFDQAVDAVAVGAVASTIVLLVLNQLQPGDSLNSSLGRIIVQTLPLSLGASVANALLSMSGENKDGRSKNQSPWKGILNDFGATAAGGLFIGFSIAPTEEVQLLAVVMDYWHELALIGLSLLTSYIIVFESGFSPQQKETPEDIFLQQPVTETIASYAISLLVAAMALYLFGQIEFGDPLSVVLPQVLILGFPTAVGGAAGRLVI